MSTPDHTLADLSQPPVPGAEQFLAGQDYERRGMLGSAALQYEEALRKNFVTVTDADSAERGGVWEARERLIEIYTGMKETFEAHGESKLALACQEALARAESWPGHVTAWDEGLGAEDMEYSEPEPGEVTD
jgi:hypothetical protein